MSNKDRKPWYAAGLAFECQACGGCCRGPGGYVWVTPGEAAALAGALGMEADAFGRRFLRRTTRGLALVDAPNGDCVLLQAGRCRAYRARPAQCRTYPWWPEVVGKPLYWQNERRHCPGIDQGGIHPLEEIARGLRESEPEEA